jgi:nitroimidazol reductase NimA-like FMN-containing flavoprotein (pyridoxamine 5'-phosphate oxidase superfamily)
MALQRYLADIARAVIDANSYMTLATADQAGQPWPSPVWYAHSEYRQFYWTSSPAARHSRNLAAGPRAGIVIFDSHAPVGTGQAVYMTVTATEVTADELPAGIHAVSARSQAQGGRTWAARDVCGPALIRLYCARVTELFAIGRNGQRILVAFSE